MASAEFSETQFVFGYLTELYFSNYRHHRTSPFWYYFGFPSTFMERNFPVDFFADYYSHSEYYQFKRSEYIGRRRGNAEIRAGVPVSFLKYYRFKIYNRSTVTVKGQFEKLIELANSFKGDLICYCAPCFHTEWDYHHHFSKKSIIQNSIIIDCDQFNSLSFQPPYFDINDGFGHYMAYKLDSPNGYLCSETKEIKTSKGLDRLEKIERNKGREGLIATVNKLYSDFYLKDHIYQQEERPKSDELNAKISLISLYLFNYYSVVWQPIFNVKT